MLAIQNDAMVCVCIRQRDLAIKHGTIHPDAHVLLDVHT